MSRRNLPSGSRRNYFEDASPLISLRNNRSDRRYINAGHGPNNVSGSRNLDRESSNTTANPRSSTDYSWIERTLSGLDSQSNFSLHSIPSLHSDGIYRLGPPEDYIRQPTPLPETKHEDPPKEPKEFDWSGSWLWEVSGAIFSVACIVVLIGFLVYINGMSYAGWEYSASPNTVIAIVSAFAKASMLVPVSACLGQLKWKQDFPTAKPLYHFQVLDQASRGPWGALEVFWTIRSAFAIVGTMLMILSLALDPFAQQILVYPSRDVVMQNGTASVPKTDVYAADPRWNPYETTAILDPTLQAALVAGLAGINVPLRPICSTNKCDYPDFASLGVCATCDVVTDHTKQNCEVISPEQFASLAGVSAIYVPIPAKCTYISPGGIYGSPDVISINQTQTSMEVQLQPLTSTSMEMRPNNTILVFSTMRYDNSESLIYTPKNYTIIPPKPEITECSVSMCEKLYTQSHPSSDGPQVSKTQPLVKQNPEDNILHTNEIEFIPKGGASTFGDSAYKIDTLSWRALDYLTSLFHTSLADSVLNAPYNSTKSGVQLGLLLFYSQNISESVQQMAASMTDSLRSRNQAIQIPGRAFQTETYIHVRWPWIILPVLLVIFSICLFVATVVRSRAHPVLWKSSILPLIMGRLELDPQNDLFHERHVDSVNSFARKVRVAVTDDRDRGIVFAER